MVRKLGSIWLYGSGRSLAQAYTQESSGRLLGAEVTEAVQSHSVNCNSDSCSSCGRRVMS